MNQEQQYQEAISIQTPAATPPKLPFVPGPNPLFSPETAEYLNAVIPSLGAMPQPPSTPTIPIRVEEQYEIAERRSFPTSTTPAYYDLLTSNPKEILITSETQDHLIDFNQQITTDSPKVFATGSFSTTAKGITRIWYQAVTGNGTIRILVYRQ